jgi:hypothetical protein
MTYQEELEAMSDGELNVLFAKTVDTYKKCQIKRCKESYAIEFISKDGDVFRYNYCNNAGDIMPLAFEKELSFMRQYDSYIVDACYLNGCCVDHKNPLRAAVIVLLLIHKSEQ